MVRSIWIGPIIYPDLYENCFRMNRNIDNRAASHLYPRNCLFLALNNCLIYVIIVYMVRSIWIGPIIYPELYENCFRMNRNIENQAASHLYPRNCLFLASNNCLIYVIIVYMIRIFGKPKDILKTIRELLWNEQNPLKSSRDSSVSSKMLIFRLK